MLPGIAATLLISHGLFTAQALKEGAKTGCQDLTAQPHGLNSMLLFAYVQLILTPAARANPGEPARAWGVCLGCALLSGVFQLFAVPVARYVRQLIPTPALFSALAGTSITFLTLDFTFQVFERPVTALPPLVVILISFVGEVRLPFGLPAGLYALLLGAALEKLCVAVPGLQPATPAFQPDPIALALPGWSGGLIWANLHEATSYLPVALPLAVLNLVGNLASLESAQAAGDTYGVEESLAMDSSVTIVGALLGSPFPTAIFIGHPAYKKMGARAGYLPLNALAVVGICCSCATSLFLLLCPIESIVTVLLWIGIVITAQAFSSSPRGSAAAVTIGLIPGICAWLVSELQKVLAAPPAAGTSTGAAPASALAPLTLELLLRTRPELCLGGLLALRQGYLLLSLVWSSLYHHIEERRFQAAARVSLVATVLSAAGLIHGFTVQGNDVLSAGPAFLPKGVGTGEPQHTAPWSFCLVYLGLAGGLWSAGACLAGGPEEDEADERPLRELVGRCVPRRIERSFTDTPSPRNSVVEVEAEKDPEVGSPSPPRVAAAEGG